MFLAYANSLPIKSMSQADSDKSPIPQDSNVEWNPIGFLSLALAATTAYINDAISEGDASIRNLMVELAKVNECARPMDHPIQDVELEEIKKVVGAKRCGCRNDRYMRDNQPML